MSGSALCPQRQDLERYTLGQVAEHDAERLEKHLQSCGDCSTTLHGLHVEDTLTDALRTGTPLLEEANRLEVRQLVERLEELPPPPEDAWATVEPAFSSPFLASAVYDFLAPPEQPDEIGRLAHYRVLERLGEGGMGVVFRAEDPRLQIQVALKVMKPELARNPLAQERFLREARAMAAVSHEHVIAIYYVGEDRGVPFLVMKLLQGEPLNGRLQTEGRLPIDEVSRIGLESARGLAAAHAKGLIHRDIKPSNIWLEASGGRVKILDFGLVHSDHDTFDLTQTDHILGTPAYMSPEQARGERGDQRSDLFSLGVVLYECCTGNRPFPGDNPLAILEAIKTHQPQPPKQLDPSIPRGLSDLIMRLLQKDPKQRPANANEVVEALEKLVAAAAPTVPDGLPPSSPPAVRQPRRVRWFVAAALVLGIATALLFGRNLVELAAQVTRIATNKGVLVIETGDDEVEVAIKGERIRIVEPRTKREYELTAGDGEIEVKERPDGVRCFTRKFTLTRGSKEVVNVRLELAREAKPVNPAPPVSDLLDRLDPAKIPEKERREWHPKQLVAVIGQHLDAKPENYLGALAFSPNGQQLLFGRGKTARLWDFAAGRETWTREQRDGVGIVAFAPDGKRVVVSGWFQQSHLLEADTGKEVKRLGGSEDVLLALAFSPDGSRILVSQRDHHAGPSTLWVWEVATGRRLLSWRGDSGYVTSLAWLPDNRHAFSAGQGKTLRLWDVSIGKEVWSRDFDGPVDAVGCTADGRLAVSGDGVRKGARLWDVKNNRPEERKTLQGHSGKPAGYMVRLAIAPNGKLLATADDGGKIIVWETSSGKKLHEWPFRTMRDECPLLAFAPDSRHLGIGNATGTVYILRLASK